MRLLGDFVGPIGYGGPGGVTPQDLEAIKKRQRFISQQRFRGDVGDNHSGELVWRNDADCLARFYSPNDVETLLQARGNDLMAQEQERTAAQQKQFIEEEGEG